MTFLGRTFRVCDIALRSAAESGTKVTDEANARFREAIHELSIHSERRLPLLGNNITVLGPFTDSFSGRDLSLTVSSRMEIAKQKDEWHHAVKRLFSKSKDDEGPTMTINFVHLRSPLLASRDPDPVIVTREPDLYGARLR